MKFDFGDTTNECIDPTSTEQIEDLIYFVCSLLSIIGSGAIVLSCCLIRELRRQPYSYVVFLSLCDFFFSLKYFIFSFNPQWMNTDGGCIVQAAWSQFWGLGSASWNGVIALNVLLLFRKALIQFNYNLVYHLYVWLVCSITTIVLLLTNSYGTSFDGSTCWICQTNLLAHLLFFAPLMLYFLISIVTLLYAAFRVKYILRKRRGEKRTLLRMLFFIIVFIGVWTIPCIHIIMILLGYKVTWMGYLDSMLIGIQGFANAIVWLTSPYFLFQIKKSSIFTKLSVCTHVNGNDGDDEVSERTYIDPVGDISDRMRTSAICGFICGIHYYMKNKDNSSQPSITKGKKVIFETEDYEEEFVVTNFVSPHDEFQVESIHIDFQDHIMKVFAPKVFQDLRKNRFNISDEFYIQNLHLNEILGALNKRKFSEGRSGSILVVVPNNPFIIKLITEPEALLLRNLISPYYRHMMNEEYDSLINRIYGLYSIATPYLPQVNYAIVMNNLFYNTLPIHRRYDMKGSWVRRQVGEKHVNNRDVLGMDQDFKDLFQYLNVGALVREKIISTVKFDTKFLKSSGIIDYSMLLGIHIVNDDSNQKEENELPRPHNNLESINFTKGIVSTDKQFVYYFGIIDMLQLYDCNKISEYCLKVYFQRKDSNGVSVQPPKKYAQRFVHFVSEITK